VRSIQPLKDDASIDNVAAALGGKDWPSRLPLPSSCYHTHQTSVNRGFALVGAMWLLPVFRKPLRTDCCKSLNLYGGKWTVEGVPKSDGL